MKTESKTLKTKKSAIADAIAVKIEISFCLLTNLLDRSNRLNIYVIFSIVLLQFKSSCI